MPDGLASPAPCPTVHPKSVLRCIEIARTSASLGRSWDRLADLEVKFPSVPVKLPRSVEP